MKCWRALPSKTATCGTWSKTCRKPNCAILECVIAPTGANSKPKKLLTTKAFRQAASLPPFPEDERRVLAKRCLESGATAGPPEQAAIAQAKLAYTREAMEICSRFRCKAFASIVSRHSQAAGRDHLRKDYAYLFERFYYFLEDKDTALSGIIVFDELDKSQSHLLVGQMERYFKFTAKGRQRAGQIIPEPFFVHSDLTTGIQLADFVAYIISWGVRFEGMMEPAREELQDLANQVRRLRYRTVREVDGNPEYSIWSFAMITDLRPRDEREEAEG